MHDNRPFYKRRQYWFILVFVIASLAGMVAANVSLVNRTERVNIQSQGQLKLKNIASQVENSLNQAESYTDSYAAQFELILSRDEPSAQEINDFVNSQNENLIAKTGGTCTATYVAYNNVLYMEDFTPGENFTLTEREWYVGAKKNKGSVFITNPYVDANTGNMCYTLSKLLDDGSTIIGLDFAMTDIQSYIEEMDTNIDGISMIINSTGMIVGHTDGSLVGDTYDVLEYHDLIDKAFNLYNDYFEYTAAGVKYTVFSAKTDHDWYLIVCLPSDLVASNLSISNILINIFLVILCVGGVLAYTLSYRKRINIQNRMMIQDEFLQRMSDDLKHPMGSIIKQVEIAKSMPDRTRDEFLEQIKASTQEMEDKLHNLSSLSNIMSECATREAKTKNRVVDTVSHRKQGAAIVAVLVLAAVISVSVNTYTQFNYIDARMQQESDEYFSQLKSWVDTNITLTNDLALHMGAQPDLYKDYEKAVEYIDNVVGDNSDISVAYIVNPNWEHTVIMNNGWEPTDPSWHVEERDWYVDTILSNDGFNISTPYRDEQTGMYCVTFSQIVYDESGNIVGLIGIDFYMDRLIEILGESYTDTGYAFLTDPSYIILNHPYDKYQMTSENSCNAADTAYRQVLVADKNTIITDYDGAYKVCLAQTDAKSGFTVVTVQNFWYIYSTMILSDVILALVFIASIGVIMMITRFMTMWQERLNAELKEAADQAIAAGKAKSDFLANMSHEIRTPINAVLGMNEMILRESKEQSVLGYAADIQSAGRTLLSIINDILDFSKIESGKMELIIADYDVSSMVNDLVNMIQARAKAKDLTFNVDIDENIPATLSGDDVRIRQIITNILTNAVKYTDRGSVTLTIKLSEQGSFVPGSVAKLYVSVSDTGKGIRKEDMDKLFSSFTRIDERANRNIEGTGLGINITASLLKMMNSELQVESTFGVGSNFYFVLEQKVINPQKIGNYRERFRAATQTEVQETKKTAPKAKILIVDDTEMNLKVEANLLKRTKAQIEVATEGKMALEMLKKNKYDIIFLDHMMPGMDGIETLQEAKRMNLLHGTPVIALTANAVVGAKQTYMDAGFDDYLSKPVKGKDMERILFQYIDKSLIVEE